MTKRANVCRVLRSSRIIDNYAAKNEQSLMHDSAKTPSPPLGKGWGFGKRVAEISINTSTPGVASFSQNIT